MNSKSTGRRSGVRRFRPGDLVSVFVSFIAEDMLSTDNEIDAYVERSTLGMVISTQEDEVIILVQYGDDGALCMYRAKACDLVNA